MNEPRVETGLFVNTSNIKLKDFIEHHWMVENEVKNLAPKTLSRYKELLDKIILPALVELRLQSARSKIIDPLIGYYSLF